MIIAPFPKEIAVMRIALSLISAAAAVGFGTASAEVIHPHKISKGDAAGPIFSQPKVVRESHGANTTLDNIVMKSSDQKFESGMYKSGPSHFDATKRDYGVDEFMLFTSGSVTLTSLDGEVTRLEAGDAVILPAEWRGKWDTEGYTKYYVIYSRTGKGM